MFRSRVPMIVLARTASTVSSPFSAQRYTRGKPPTAPQPQPLSTLKFVADSASKHDDVPASPVGYVNTKAKLRDELLAKCRRLHPTAKAGAIQSLKPSLAPQRATADALNVRVGVATGLIAAYDEANDSDGRVVNLAKCLTTALRGRDLAPPVRHKHDGGVDNAVRVEVTEATGITRFSQPALARVFFPNGPFVAAPKATLAQRWQLVEALSSNIRLTRYVAATPHVVECAAHQEKYDAEIPVVAVALGKATNQLFSRYVPCEAPDSARLDGKFGTPTVVTGSSGSGKTHHMVTAVAQHTGRTPDLVIYATGIDDLLPSDRAADDVSDREKDERTEKFLALVRDVTAHAVRELLKGHYAAEGSAAQREAAKNLEVSDIVDKKCQLAKAPADCVVRVVLDEVGGLHHLLRAYVRDHAEARKAISAMLNCDVDCVELVAGGTGSQDPDAPYGSTPDAYRVEPADELLRPTAASVLEMVRNSLFGAEDTAAKRLLTTSDAWGVIEGVATNMRGAALVQRHTNALWTTADRLRSLKLQPRGLVDEDALQHAIARLQVLAMDVLRLLRSLNGMWKLSRADTVHYLASALCVDVWGFDQFDKSRRKDEEKLTRKFGVLTDRAVWVPAPDGDPESDDYANDLFEQYQATSPVKAKVSPGRERARAIKRKVDGTSTMVLAVPDDKRGRFVVPPAYAAMFTAEFVDEGARGLDHAAHLERTAAETLAIACAVTPVDAKKQSMGVAATLRRMRMQRLPGEAGVGQTYHGRLIDSSVRPRDLLPLRVALHGDEVRAAAPGRVTLGTVDKHFPFVSVTRFSKGAKPYAPHLVPPHLSAAASGPSAHVYLNAGKAPYADVAATVFGVDGEVLELVLLQAKRLTSTYRVSRSHVGDELAKSGVLSEDGLRALRGKNQGVDFQRMRAAVRNLHGDTPVSFTLLLAQSDAPSAVLDKALEKASGTADTWHVRISDDARVVDDKGEPLPVTSRERPFFPLFVQRVTAPLDVDAVEPSEAPASADAASGDPLP